MAGIAFGSSLSRVDRRALSASESRTIARLGSTVRDYLVGGWVLTMVAPVKLLHVESRERTVVVAKPRADAPAKPIQHPNSVFVAVSQALPRVSIWEFREMLQRLVFDAEPPPVDLRKYLVGTAVELRHCFVETVLGAFNVRPLAVRELAALVGDQLTDKDIEDVLRQHLDTAKFSSHLLCARVLKELQRLGVRVAVHDRLIRFFDFDAFDAPVSLGDGLPREPWLAVFCAFSDLLESHCRRLKGHPEHRDMAALFDDLMQLLDESDPQYFSAYRRFMANKDRRELIGGVLRRDDAAEFGDMTDDELGQEVLGLCGIDAGAGDVRATAAALAGARECLGTCGELPATEQFERAAVWGNCWWLQFQASEQRISEYATQYHRYGFPIVKCVKVIELAREYQNLFVIHSFLGNAMQL
jgi:hypothetical protein